MQAMILAAGYATRLYPLTLDKPKALLPIVKEKAILDYIVDEIETIAEIKELTIISNEKFYPNFVEWRKKRKTRLDIEILNDHSTDDSNKLGAVGDIQFAIDRKSIQDDLLIMAGDNIFTFHLKDYVDFYKKTGKDMILVKKMERIEDLRRMANVTLDKQGKVLDMEEKPQNPKSDIAAFASYLYKKETVAMIRQYLDEGNNPDAPGFFPAWLYKRKELYAYTFQGECYDIGTPDSYREVCEIFAEKGQ